MFKSASYLNIKDEDRNCFLLPLIDNNFNLGLKFFLMRLLLLLFKLEFLSSSFIFKELADLNIFCKTSLLCCFVENYKL